MTIAKPHFRQVMGRFATGVTVVTTCVHDSLVGLTVNSFCSVSLEPPLVLVCIDLNSHTLPYFRESGSFVVNVLSDQQEYLSRCFATPSQDRYEHFCHANYHLTAAGSPVIDGVLAFIDARVVAEYPGGDHIIFVGQVESMGVGSQGAFTESADEQCSNSSPFNGEVATGDQVEPLAYYRGQYCRLTYDSQKSSLATYYDEHYVKVG